MRSMRWDNLKMTTEEEERLPGYSDPAVIRHFDVPEAMGVKFYEVRAKSALNRVPEISQVPFRWTINPYRGCTHACLYCFARPTHEYLDMNPRDDFDRKIVVKVNLPEVLRRELNRPSWQGEHVALGTNTDPYQWVEKRYRLTRGVWEAMRDFKNPCSVLTKSPLLLRDLDLFQEIAAVTSFTANLSIPTIDEKVWRQTEPHTPNPRARIEAVAELTRAGIQCGVLVAPLIPGVNDDPAQVQEIVEACAEAGASHIGGICLHLRGAVKDIWFEWLEAYRPDLIPRYERMYARGAYAPKAERERIMNLVRDARPGSAETEPSPDYRRRAARPNRSSAPEAAARNSRTKPPPMAGRLMRGGLAEARSSRRDDDLVDNGAPIQQSLF
jgi:DNA repair photolyase